MKKVLASVILLFTSLPLHAQSCPEHFYLGRPPTTIEEVVVLCKKGFAIGYSKKRKAALWTAQKVEPRQAETLNQTRTPFQRDPAVEASAQGSLEDYTNSGYDRGHLVPFENLAYAADVAAESMFLTNVVPQNPTMNRGIWAKLEADVRNQALKEGTIYVITGPVFENGPRIGPNKLEVPSRLYKVIIDPRNKTAKTYIIPNAVTSNALLNTFVSTRINLRRMTSVNPSPSVRLTDVK